MTKSKHYSEVTFLRIHQHCSKTPSPGSTLTLALTGTAPLPHSRLANVRHLKGKVYPRESTTDPVSAEAGKKGKNFLTHIFKTIPAQGGGGTHF